MNKVENTTKTDLLKTAVLFVVFNRLDTTKQVFKAIREAKPPRLYIASDGPRETKEGEEQIVKDVREYITSHIDWECEVKTLFREKNLSCGPSVKQSIDWFFDNEEMGIILEDDVIPNTSFFKFSEDLLIKYQFDDRIGMISGNNHINFNDFGGDSYVFSKFAFTWGWATWKRSWVNMDLDMNWENTSFKNSIISNMGYTEKSKLYWQNNINAIKMKKVNAWDYQWFLSLSSQNQLCIFPMYNLVANIGFGDDATHTFGEPKQEYIKQSELSFPLIHPKYVLPLKEFEEVYERMQIKLPVFWRKIIPQPIKKLIKNFLKTLK